MPKPRRFDAKGMFAGAENILITGGTFNESIASENSQHSIKVLRENTAAGAYHNSGERRDPPKCHPGTREVVNREIMDWVRGSTRSETERFLWIYGPAGTGKSSIAQTIAELCEKEGLLASDFFFSRTVPGRNTDSKLISTLACQLTVSTPEIRPYVVATITSDVLIFSRALQVQLENLILKPFERLVSSNSGHEGHIRYPYLFIVDGLDECDTPESQHNILSSLSSAIQSSVIFIIASRPEAVIREKFNSSALYPYTRRVALDDHYKPDEDIRLFIDSKFSDIKRTHSAARYLPADWPSNSDVTSIVQKASGQFIYASTVMKYIGSRGGLPTAALGVILNLASSSDDLPFADLDAVYAWIFQSLKKSTREKALTVFAFIIAYATIYVREFHPVPDRLGAYLGYEPGEIFIVLEDLHAIVDVPSNPIKELRLFHASLGDFLQDKSRSKEVFIDIAAYRARFAKICIDNMLTACMKGEYFDSWPLVSSLTDTEASSCALFLPLFKRQNPDRVLLGEFASDCFPITKFIKFVFRGAAGIPDIACSHMLRDLHRLFKWIHEHDTDLYNIYIGQLDDCLTSRILYDTSQPHWQCIFTALTLYDKVRMSLTQILGLCQFLDVDFAFVKNFLSSPLRAPLSLSDDDIDFILSRVSRLLMDPELSRLGKYYHVDRSSYIGLARQIFDSAISRKPVPNCIPDMTLSRFFLNLLVASLKKVPAEVELGKYMREKEKEYTYGMRLSVSDLRPTVEEYIKSCDLVNGPEDTLLALRLELAPIKLDIDSRSRTSTPSLSEPPSEAPRIINDLKHLPVPSSTTKIPKKKRERLRQFLRRFIP